MGELCFTRIDIGAGYLSKAKDTLTLVSDDDVSGLCYPGDPAKLGEHPIHIAVRIVAIKARRDDRLPAPGTAKILGPKAP